MGEGHALHQVTRARKWLNWEFPRNSCRANVFDTRTSKKKGKKSRTWSNLEFPRNCCREQHIRHSSSGLDLTWTMTRILTRNKNQKQIINPIMHDIMGQQIWTKHTDRRTPWQWACINWYNSEIWSYCHSWNISFAGSSNTNWNTNFPDFCGRPPPQSNTTAVFFHYKSRTLSAFCPSKWSRRRNALISQKRKYNTQRCCCCYYFHSSGQSSRRSGETVDRRCKRQLKWSRCTSLKFQSIATPAPPSSSPPPFLPLLPYVTRDRGEKRKIMHNPDRNRRIIYATRENSLEWFILIFVLLLDWSFRIKI